MKKRLLAWSLLLSILFYPQLISASGDLNQRYPRISNPEFFIHNNVVKLSFDYEDVAGSIQDARITLVVAVSINSQMDRLADFHFIPGGWKGFFWSSADNSKLTSGRITTKVCLPWYTGINQETKITGFGLAVADSRSYISNPLFVEVELIRDGWYAAITRLVSPIARFIKEKLP